MKLFERFIRYLTVVGVAFAAFLFIFPNLGDRVLVSYGMIFGPVIVIAALAAAYLRGQKEKKQP